MSELDGNSNSLAFKEEQKSHASIDKQIDRLITDVDFQLDELQSKIDDCVVHDADDYYRFRSLNDQRNYMHLQLTDYKKILDSPYFGHLEAFTKDDKQIDCFIGKEGLLDPQTAESIIVDWRSPIGGVFYNKKDVTFIVKGKQYSLLFRRAVDIQSRTLRTVKTEYDTAAVSLEGDIIDDFLISVLRDKRRNRKLTDIIRTIQNNQNDIIRKPLDESFVVQGCAGSGKTMILLHRLSYLAFNNRNADFEHFLILTPNENFNIHVDELSRELGLNKIRRLTVESYYVELINSMGWQDTVVKSGKKMPKITATIDGIKSEKLVDNNLLSVIYSDDFYNDLMDEYHNKSDEAVKNINNINAIDILNRCGYKVKPLEEINYQSYISLINSLSNAIDKYTGLVTKKQDNEKTLEKICERIKALNDDFSRTDEELQEVKDTVLTKCNQSIVQINEEIHFLEGQIDQNKNVLGELRKERQVYQDSIAPAVQSLKIINDMPNTVVSYEYITSSYDEIAVVINKTCNSQIEQIQKLYSQLNSLAFYNFGKRNRLKNEINEKREDLSAAAGNVINDYRLVKTTEIDNIRNTQIEPIDKELSDVENNLEQKNMTKDGLLSKKKLYEICLDAFEQDQYPDLSDRFTKVERLKIGDVLNPYLSVYERYNKVQSALLISEKTKEQIYIELRESYGEIPDKDELQSLNKALEIIEQFDAIILYEDLEKKIKDLYKKYKQPYTKANYRHKLYVKLLFSYVYYGSSDNVTYYINIDEAQDLALTEYRLIHNILGYKTVFNLYGDVNQAVYEYKGISDWAEVDELTSGKVYLLNENYRNTQQITEYCNDRFDADVTPIGLSGEKVLRFENSDKAFKELIKIHKDNPDYRIAIIYRRGVEGLAEIVKEKNLECVFNEVDPDVVSVITVEEAKGLEFEAVMVVDNYMTDNELYISYTRALDNLILTTLYHSAFVTNVDEEDQC